MTRGRRYQILDVFTDVMLTGNPLAVVFDADDLDSAAMVAITREFHLSETVFVRRPEHPAHAARVRIFTPARELPFAGHPTVGAAVAIARRDEGYGAYGYTKMVTLEERIGLVRCAVRPTESGADCVEFDVPAEPQLLHTAPPVDAVAGALGLKPYEIGFARFPVAVAGAGVRFTYVPVNGLGAIRRARPDTTLWEETFPDDHAAVYLFTAEVERPGSSYHARMFAPGFGIAEDPATGAAVAGFAAPLVAYGGFGDGYHEFVIEQGLEMGRPSLIRLEVTVEAGELRAARLAGEAVIVAEGRLFV